ncbi:protein kinase [Penicillium malachiteum]|uniref:protein kinase n=1 Tax=Penicillium malachiteum TaxID=1324776 RepID=UPI0025492572|nr:protein kinase [Penicillium malachiteum]KAJ5721960.1 protein kinase [Penicillium malachiteum]
MIGLPMRPTASLPSSFLISRTRWVRVPFPPHRLAHTMTHNQANQAIEEQSLPFYHRKQCYPVEIGHVTHNRYRIIAKIGYGAYSTVWLPCDHRVNEYVLLKVSVQADHSHAGNSPVLNEINMLRRLEQFAKEDHPGLDFTRQACDIFETESVGGAHHCIAFKAQGNSVRKLQEIFPDAKFPKLLVKSLIHRLFFSVNWLYATCGATHTDISPQSVSMGIEDSMSLKYVEDQETRCPSSPILSPVNSSTTVLYRSRPTILEVSGHPILADFGQMRLVEGCVNRD